MPVTIKFVAGFWVQKTQRIIMEKKLPKTTLQAVSIEHISATKDGAVKVREVIVSWDENEKRRYLKLQAKNEKCQILDKFKNGEMVDVTFVISCVKKFGNNDEVFYFQNVNLYYIKSCE